GFSTGSLMLFPLIQVELTAFFGTLLASGAYLGFSWLINHLFASSLQGLESVCLLLPRHFGMALACAMGLSFLAAFGSALKSTRIQPSEVIRDV
ncbi:MAG: ABC transporter permease, partial [Desulfovibrio sp.]